MPNTSNISAILEQQQHRLIDIVYIGPKEIKRESITGKGFIFPRMKPMPVPLEYAGALLSFPKVFIESCSLEEAKKAEDEKRKAAEEKQKAEALKAEEKRKAACMIVNIPQASGDSKKEDIGKYSIAKLNTLVESLDLRLERGAQEDVGSFRVRVRDSIRKLTDSES